MQIRAFGKFLVSENVTDHKLQNCTVVVDAQNFFFRLYQESGLQYIFGCESDKYAEYMKTYLNMFKKANVNCYFIFKGGHKDLMKLLTTLNDKDVYAHCFRVQGRNFNINEVYSDIVLPIFMKDVYKQVLDEMGFNYTVCELESKNECIALAQKLNCPVISYDIEFAFAGVPYIMKSTLKFDELNNHIDCRMFSLDAFLKKYHINEEKLALFAALTDEKNFPKDHFIDFIKSLRIPLSFYRRNVAIIYWLSRTEKKQAAEQIFRYTKPEDREKFLEVERKVREMIRRQEEPGIPSQYLLNGNQIEVTEKDQFWFEKGVVSKHIAIQQINPTRSGIVEGSWAIADYNDENPKLLSMDIVKYTHNLLTNFEEKEFIFYVDKEKIPMSLTNSIQKPYEVSGSPFENGWKNLKGELFEHFLTESLQGMDLRNLEAFPEDARMLIISLIYFSAQKQASTRNEVFAVLLSYVALNVIVDSDKNNNLRASSEEKIMDYIDKQSITEADKQTARGLLASYLAYIPISEARAIFDAKLLHPLVEFQHCLQSLNYLNVLCGKFYMPTVYSETFNGSFVYKVLYAIKRDFEGDYMRFLIEKLNSAPTVYGFLERFLTAYDDILAGI